MHKPEPVTPSALDLQPTPTMQSGPRPKAEQPALRQTDGGVPHRNTTKTRGQSSLEVLPSVAAQHRRWQNRCPQTQVGVQDLGYVDRSAAETSGLDRLHGANAEALRQQIFGHTALCTVGANRCRPSPSSNLFRLVVGRSETPEAERACVGISLSPPLP